MKTGLNSGADALFIDLEEPQYPFPEDQQERLRQRAHSFLESLRPIDRNPLIFVRVQPWDSGGTLRDLRAVMTPSVAGIILPKIHGPEEIHAMDAILTCLEVELGLPRGSKIIYPILETAQALRLTYEIAAASPRVEYVGGLMAFQGDTRNSVGFHSTDEGQEVLYLLSKANLDARAAGVRYPIGFVGRVAGSDDVKRANMLRLRDIGYMGTIALTPDDIPLIHEVFSPRPEEIEYWQAVLSGVERAEESGQIAHARYREASEFRLHPFMISEAREGLDRARSFGLVN